MTQIQASVNVEDKVDSKIEQKIKAIGIASITTANQLSTLKNAVSGYLLVILTDFQMRLQV